MTDETGNGRLLARVDERTKSIEDKLDLYCGEFNKKADDHEARLRSLEGDKWLRNGLAAVIGGVGGFIAGLTN